MKTVIRHKKTWQTIALLICFHAMAFASPVNNTPDYYYQSALLQKQILRFTEIDQNGGWQKLVLNKKQYKESDSAPFVKQLKRRLQITGQLQGIDSSGLYTPELASAVKRIQRQFGFKENGVTDALVVAALNVPVKERIRQLQINLQRSQSLPSDAQGRRIIVNIPEYKMHIYEGNQHVMEINVVVGSEKNQTAIFNDELTHVVFSPYWNVPQSIVQNEILPAVRKNRRYLANHGYEQTGTENGLPVIRQKPGKNNSLGLVKFLFPNEHAIYFHDSPAKTLFSHRVRAYSHGCVRVAEPVRLAEYLLSNDPNWDAFKIDEAMNAGKEKWVKLNEVVPVSIIYLTAWVDDAGMVNFRDDIYEMDKSIAIASTEKAA
ncbi:MAG: hypothetical protein EOO10_14970 [Chitinophagaceae bacterium]|nr:MAG: hypothetical protein EOO10_14970 [Chitinophagaceae bacterium]